MDSQGPIQEEKSDKFKKLEERIPYVENIFTNKEIYEKTLDRLLEDSKYIGLSLRYPYQDFSNKELPKKYDNWQIRCAEQIYKGIGYAGIKSYAENGLAWTRDSDYLPYSLTSEIEPLVGYIIEEINEDEDVNKGDE